MSHSAKRFAPGWPLWIFLLAFLPLLIFLGFWQLDRADEKRQMQAQMDANRGAVAQTLTELQQQADPSWRPLYLEGQFDPEHIWLLDNRIRGARPVWKCCKCLMIRRPVRAWSSTEAGYPGRTGVNAQR